MRKETITSAIAHININIAIFTLDIDIERKMISRLIGIFHQMSIIARLTTRRRDRKASAKHIDDRLT
jgi:hypothetical protein